jgi:serine protease Do
LVADVSANSPAQKAGIERGDIIVGVNGKPVEDANGLRMTISMMQPDTKANMKVLRDGSEEEVAVKLATMPTEEAANVPDHNGSDSSSSLSGVSVQNLDAETAKQVGVSPETKGVVVTRVDPSSDAAEAGLQRGDVIQEVNRHAVKSTSEFEQAMRSSKDKPLFLVDRHGNTMYVSA